MEESSGHDVAQLNLFDLLNKHSLFPPYALEIRHQVLNEDARKQYFADQIIMQL